MKKTYLINYEKPMFLGTDEFTVFKLKLKIIWLYGLWVSYEDIYFKMYNYMDSSKYFDHWNELIENGDSIKISQ